MLWYFDDISVVFLWTLMLLYGKSVLFWSTEVSGGKVGRAVNGGQQRLTWFTDHQRLTLTSQSSVTLSFLGWTTAMLFWLDFHQTQSNLYKWFRMQRHDWSSMSPKEPMLHLSSSHCTGYQWQLTSSSRHWCLHTERPQAQHYFHSLLRIYIPSRSLGSASERRLVVPSQRGSKSLSRTFSFTIPGWWNNLPTPIRNAGSLSIFKQQLKTHLFRHYLTSS